jgi:hypothetical protein
LAQDHAVTGPAARAASARGPLASIRGGVRLLPLLVRHPAIAGRWLGGARAAQVALALFVLAVPIGLPAVLEPALAEMYPPIRTRKKLIGPISIPTTRDDPRRERRRGQILAVAWGGGLAGIALLLLAAAPRAVERAAREAAQREERGDSLLGRLPLQSLELYRSAVPLAPDADRRAALGEKIRKAESLLARAEGPVEGWSVEALAHPQTTVEPEATVIEPVTPPAAHDSTLVGARGRYRIEAELGRGGMGVVYRARDTALERTVALKELPHHLAGRSDVARRFRQEARLLARLSHPHIVQVHDLLEEAGRLWIALEFVDGGTLADAIERKGGLPWREALRLAQPLAQALGFAHAQGVIHRDVKPINILLTREGVPKITDFGLARLLESSVHTQEGTLLGSARYMSPEQAAGRAADARSDVYALGVTLYEMLSGSTPFEGETASVLAQHLSRPPPPLRERVPHVPPSVESLVLAMLAKDPDGRPADLGAVADALATAAG